MTDRNLTLFDGELDRRTILKTMGATAAASGFAGCQHDEDPDDDRGSGVFHGSEVLTKNANGALGSDASQERQQLYFVETGTNALVRYDLIPEVLSTVSSGTATISRTATFDFESGNTGTSNTDVHWNFETDTERALEPHNDARITLVDGSYSAVSGRDLPTLGYSTESIDGSTDSNRLTEGTVFAVETTEGNYAKAKVESYGESLEIEYETYEIADQRVELGTGYNTPEDVVLAGDGSTAYVVERGNGGALLEVTLSNADRANATVVASGFGAAHQLALDQPSGLGYVTTDTAVVRVDLNSGTTTTVAAGLNSAIGIVVDSDEGSAYVSEQTLGSSTATSTPTGSAGGMGGIRRIDLANGQKEELVSGLTEPYHLAWADSTREKILFVEQDPKNTLAKLDVVSESVGDVVQDVPVNPASVSMHSLNEGLICSENAIQQFDLSAFIDLSGPLFSGIGHIPVSSVDSDGYANTPADFPFTVTDAPFGGNLHLRLDHYLAREDEGATHYRVMVDGDVKDNSWNGLAWNDTERRYEATEQSADGNGFFSLRSNASKWFRPRLGYILRTGSLSNGLHDLTVAFYSSASDSDEITEKSTKIRIDNEGPTARLGRIIHQLQNGQEVVGACAIIDEPTDQFKFEVTASDPQQHLRRWRLVARWGNNEHDVVNDQRYADNGSGKSWTGPKNELKGDPDSGSGWWAATERQCAHTFVLRAWTRSINGYHYIQRSGYHKSLTLMLPE